MSTEYRFLSSLHSVLSIQFRFFSSSSNQRWFFFKSVGSSWVPFQVDQFEFDAKGGFQLKTILFASSSVRFKYRLETELNWSCCIPTNKHSQIFSSLDPPYSQGNSVFFNST